MTEGEKSGEARKALVDAVKGKAKEIFGAVTGNDSLTAEGQLEQTDAKERKDANRAEAEADAEAAQAESLADDAKRDACRMAFRPTLSAAPVVHPRASPSLKYARLKVLSTATARRRSASAGSNSQ